MSAPTIWEVWNPDTWEIKEVGGSQARCAAETYREEDPDDWEAGESITLAVRKKGELEWEFFNVLRECNPTYSAEVAERPEGFEMPDDEGGAE